MEPLAERLRPRTLDDYIGAHCVVYPLGTTGRGQDYAGTDYR